VNKRKLGCIHRLQDHARYAVCREPRNDLPDTDTAVFGGKPGTARALLSPLSIDCHLGEKSSGSLRPTPTMRRECHDRRRDRGYRRFAWTRRGAWRGARQPWPPHARGSKPGESYEQAQDFSLGRYHTQRNRAFLQLCDNAIASSHCSSMIVLHSSFVDLVFQFKKFDISTDILSMRKPFDY
jgi:hypothetical protein